MFTKLQQKRFFQMTAAWAIFALVAVIFPVQQARAAALTKLKDTLSTLQSNTVANHTIEFVTPTGVDAPTDTITINFTGFTIGSVDYTDIDFAVDDDANCNGSWTDKTLATSAASATWGAAIGSSTLTLTAPTDATTGEITAGRCVQIQIGTNATAGVTGDAQLTNPNNQSTLAVPVAGAFGDSGTFALDFVTAGAVNVTSTVDATLSFTISDTAVGFGGLSVSTGRWATGDAAGTDASSPATPTAAHTMAIATNAQSGWAITYYGTTLTSGANTISAATVSSDSDGTPGTEQFALCASTSGDATIAAGYARSTTSSWNFVASTTTTLVSETTSTDTETISVSYLANIAGTTEAGSYTTDLTYVATSTF